MTTPREIIRDGIIKETGVSLATVRADAAIEALTSAGYRILSEADLAARDDAAWKKGFHEAADTAGKIAAMERRRALKGGKP